MRKNKWYHVAVLVRSGRTQFFVDGKRISRKQFMRKFPYITFEGWIR